MLLFKIEIIDFMEKIVSLADLGKPLTFLYG